MQHWQVLFLTNCLNPQRGLQNSASQQGRVRWGREVKKVIPNSIDLDLTHSLFVTTLHDDRRRVVWIELHSLCLKNTDGMRCEVSSRMNMIKPCHPIITASSKTNSHSHYPPAQSNLKVKKWAAEFLIHRCSWLQLDPARVKSRMIRTLRPYPARKVLDKKSRCS